MKLKSKLLIIFLFSILLLSLAPQTSANFTVYASFRDAYYGDLDLDGAQDDIRLEISLDLYNSYVTTYVDLYINIVLPSGTEFSFVLYLKLIKSTTHGYFELSLNTYNTALEPGWYTASAAAFTSYDFYTIQESITFDPPGEISGDPPSIELV